MKMNLDIECWGTIPYREAWERQTRLFDNIIAARAASKPYWNRLVFCEHPHVYTLGKHGKETNMLLGEERLKRIEAELVHIDRGGDITYHGPGQIVCYPILCLEDFHLGLKEYIALLEESVIATCRAYGIEADKVRGAAGVWLGIGLPSERKICAIGVRCSHSVTMHGLALNVNTDLRYFSYIHPCGFTDKEVTSIAAETGHPVSMNEVGKLLEKELAERLRRCHGNKKQ